MCTPLALVAAGTTAMQVVAQRQQAAAETRLIDAQEKQAQSQINQQASVQAGKVAMAARRDRADAATRAGGMGINLGSNSFLSAMQGSAEGEDNNEGLISVNEQNQRLASEEQANSELASKASSPTLLGGAIDIGMSAVAGSMQNSAWYGRGTPLFAGTPYPGAPSA